MEQCDHLLLYLVHVSHTALKNQRQWSATFSFHSLRWAEQCDHLLLCLVHVSHTALKNQRQWSVTFSFHGLRWADQCRRPYVVAITLGVHSAGWRRT